MTKNIEENIVENDYGSNQNGINEPTEANAGPASDTDDTNVNP